MSDSFSRFERSVLLIGASWNVLRSDRELLVLPILSGIATLLVLATFAGVAVVAGAAGHIEAGTQPEPWFYVGLFVFYLFQYLVIIYFNTALVGAAIERLEGGDPTLRSALALADRRFGAIVGYALVSATLGLLLRMLAERLGLIGRFIESGVGFAWTVMTFLVVPVLAAEGCGPLAAIERSASLLKKTWGENLIGNAGISLVFAIAGAVVVAIGGFGGFRLASQGSEALAVALFVVTGVLFLGIVLVSTTLTGIYAAAVYHYAVHGRPPKGFGGGLIEDSFSRKGA